LGRGDRQTSGKLFALGMARNSALRGCDGREHGKQKAPRGGGIPLKQFGRAKDRSKVRADRTIENGRDEDEFFPQTLMLGGKAAGGFAQLFPPPRRGRRRF